MLLAAAIQIVLGETRLESSLKSYEYNPKDTFAIYDIATCYDGCLKDIPNAIKYYSEFISTRAHQKKPESDKTTKRFGHFHLRYGRRKRLQRDKSTESK